MNLIIRDREGSDDGGGGGGKSPILGEEDYDPHLHRNVPSATSNTETIIHLLKGSLGTGILAMPQAFYYAGYLSGIINTIIIGALCTYCLHILVI